MTVSKIGGKRQGAGRKKGSTKAEGMPTKVVRVSSEISKEQLDALPSVIASLDYWEEQCVANPEVRTYDKLRQFIDEVRSLGF